MSNKRKKRINPVFDMTDSSESEVDPTEPGETGYSSLWNSLQPSWLELSQLRPYEDGETGKIVGKFSFPTFAYTCSFYPINDCAERDKCMIIACIPPRIHFSTPINTEIEGTAPLYSFSENLQEEQFLVEMSLADANLCEWNAYWLFRDQAEIYKWPTWIEPCAIAHIEAYWSAQITPAVIAYFWSCPLVYPVRRLLNRWGTVINDSKNTYGRPVHEGFVPPWFPNRQQYVNCRPHRKLGLAPTIVDYLFFVIHCMSSEIHTCGPLLKPIVLRVIPRISNIKSAAEFEEVVESSEAGEGLTCLDDLKSEYTTRNYSPIEDKEVYTKYLASAALHRLKDSIDMYPRECTVRSPLLLADQLEDPSKSQHAYFMPIHPDHSSFDVVMERLNNDFDYTKLTKDLYFMYPIQAIHNSAVAKRNKKALAKKAREERKLLNNERKEAEKMARAIKNSAKVSKHAPKPGRYRNPWKQLCISNCFPR